VQTIRIGYIENEDRVLVEFINPDSKATVLFTRRMMRRVIHGIASLLARSSRAMARAPVDVKLEVLIIEHQSAIQAAEANAPGAGGSTVPPDPVADGAAVPVPDPDLLIKIDIQTLQRVFHLTFAGQAGTIQVLDLSRPELHRLLASLHKLAHSAGWNIEDEVGWLKEAEAPFAPSSKAAS
jgi:hypothetical protein